MKIVHLAAELAPIAKVGGLGDVVFGLSRHLIHSGHDVEIVIPKYDCIDWQEVTNLEVLVPEFWVDWEGQRYPNTAWRGWVMDFPVTFIEAKHPHRFFDRGCIYACDDDPDRFLYFCRCALEYLDQQVEHPEVINIHDWQTAVVAPLYHDVYSSRYSRPAALVLSLHNLEYQGQISPQEFTRVGLDPGNYMTSDKLKDHYQQDKLNLLRGGIQYADYVNTVSPRYAEEVKEPTGGRGLEDDLRAKGDRFCGILNGIDREYWCPETDSLLPHHFSAYERPPNENGQLSLRNKRLVKESLRKHLGLQSDEDRPVVSIISRLVPQKGIHLIRHCLYRTLEQGGQFVLLGSSPIPEINQDFKVLQETFAHHPHARIEMENNERLAHLIFAGSDILVVPSMFEPCGLTQLIAMRYGTVPVVRCTGGLADTVADIDYSPLDPSERNGFVFDQTDEMALDSALDRAIHCWKHEPDRWWQLLRQGMLMDFGWERSAESYLKMYQSAHERAFVEVR